MAERSQWVLWSAREARWVDLRTTRTDPRQTLLLYARRPPRRPHQALSIMTAVAIGLVLGFLLGALCVL